MKKVRKQFKGKGVRGTDRHKSDRVSTGMISAITFAAAVTGMFLLGGMSSNAQVPTEYETVPPPRKTVSEEEQKRLDSESGVRRRTQLVLSLMDARLKRAETLNAADDIDGAFDELGGFHALMEDAIVFLEGSDTNRSRVLNYFKRFEIGLRRFTPRLELIRRDMPISHEFYIRSLLRQLREMRTRAVEPLFGDTVLSDNNSL